MTSSATSLNAIDRIFGSPPMVIECRSCSIAINGENKIIVGDIVLISNASTHYKICSSRFFVPGTNREAEGFFHGELDEIGRKLIKIYFQHLAEGAVLYLNETQVKILKNEKRNLSLSPVGQTDPGLEEKIKSCFEAELDG